MTPSDSNDWHWQLSHCITSHEELSHLPGYVPPTAEQLACAQQYPMLATPFYLSLANSASQDDPIIRQCLPQPAECEDGADKDPLGEQNASPVPRLVHRYHDRALFVTCGCCAVHCRHCMRKRVWETPLPPPTDNELEAATGYLRSHPEVREVLISGGDPLTLEDDDIARVLRAFASVPSIEMLRIGSRTLVALPQRYTEELCNLLGSCGKTVWLASHFNHPQELSSEAEAAVLRLMRHGVPVVNQTVLLKGINDDADILAKLFTGLLRIRIKPYYLFHGDPVCGTLCFRTGIDAGVAIMAQLRKRLSGMALPAFAIDLPQGGGKVRIEPDSFAGLAPDGTRMYYDLDGHPVLYAET
ncbi:MAG: KamA family radical SAM protein [Victivallales bacterium]|nr:KamA family radical SAM protein [Victivallales bacterium]